MIMSLKPVVMMVPVCQVTQVTDFHYSFAFLIAVFFHSFRAFNANLLIFALITILTDEKNNPDMPDLCPDVTGDIGCRSTV